MELQVGTEREAPSSASGAPGSRAGDRLERELAQARARIDELEAQLARHARTRAELIHLVSHELRTPITVISGFGRLLVGENGGPLSEAQHHFVDEMLKSCRRLDRFVGDLLAACPETGSPLDVAIERADLHRTLAAQLESLAPLVDERGITLERVFAAKTSWLDFDPRRIEQVVTNLLTNALRYGRDGGTIRLATASVDTPEGSKVEVAVDDDGPGIPIEDRERLFAPYVRGSGQQRCEGLGIGLAISNRIVAAHGGTLRAETSPLGGARLVFGLPVKHSQSSHPCSEEG